MAESRDPLTERVGPRLAYHAFVPAEATVTPLVLVHGSSRRAVRMFRAFLPMALRLNVPLLAPAFSTERFRGYQSLAGADGPLAAKDALLNALQDAWTSLQLPAGPVDLLGFSGGAQFAHRFAMICPEQVHRAVVVSAGWYTGLSASRPFPDGSGASPRSAGRPIDVEGFLRLPLQVMVGASDVQRDGALRTGRVIDRRQGPDRLTRALRWTDHLEEEARTRGIPSALSFDLLPDTAHSFPAAVRRGGLVERAFAFLHPQPGQGCLAVDATTEYDR
jgi:pimeloyl-ACP methyl ester carboxylesterase